ncbi:MAG: hypothetical protein CMO33_08575 [Verrucomicrobia bacterium]|nr:hypothetical protein [Verrucomicrobiota bacterium]
MQGGRFFEIFIVLFKTETPRNTPFSNYLYLKILTLWDNYPNLTNPHCLIKAPGILAQDSGLFFGFNLVKMV